jgi:hypothetical protein
VIEYSTKSRMDGFHRTYQEVYFFAGLFMNALCNFSTVTFL